MTNTNKNKNGKLKTANVTLTFSFKGFSWNGCKARSTSNGGKFIRSGLLYVNRNLLNDGKSEN